MKIYFGGKGHEPFELTTTPHTNHGQIIYFIHLPQNK